MKTSIPKIRNVRLKSGGKLGVVKTPERVHCHNSAVHFSQTIDEKTRAAAFFVLQFDGNVKTGFSYMGGTALAEMVGSAELLSDDIYAHWQTPQDDNDPA